MSTARAKVIVTIEVSLTDTWGTDCTVGQIQKQAKDGALGKLRKMAENTSGIKIVSPPMDVKAIIVDE